jgi:hypothetical protein
MRPTARCVIGAIVIGVLAAGCSTSPPSATARLQGLSVQAAIDWFEERTLACVGPGEVVDEARQWTCTHEFEDGDRLEARITGDERGILRLRGATKGFGAEESASFLGATVAAIALPVALREDLTRWAMTNRETGDSRRFDAAIIQLDPAVDTRFVDVSLGP